MKLDSQAEICMISLREEEKPSKDYSISTNAEALRHLDKEAPSFSGLNKLRQKSGTKKIKISPLLLTKSLSFKLFFRFRAHIENDNIFMGTGINRRDFL